MSFFHLGSAQQPEVLEDLRDIQVGLAERGGAVREEVNSKENLAGSKRQRGKGMTDFRQSSALASAGVITLALTEGNY